MDIPASTPVIVPAVPEQVFDLWRIPEFMVNWPSPSMPMECGATFISARRNADGNLVDGRTSRFYRIADLWQLAAEDAEVASVLNSLITVLTRKATEAGVI